MSKSRRLEQNVDLAVVYWIVEDFDTAYDATDEDEYWREKYFKNVG